MLDQRLKNIFRFLINSFSIFLFVAHVSCSKRSKSGTAEIANDNLNDRAVPNAGEWLGHLGSLRNGHSSEISWNQNWIDKEPQLIWKKELGLGAAGVSVYQGRVFCVGNTNDKDKVFCLDAITGKVLWEISYQCPVDRRMFEGGPATTPTLDPERGHAYVLSHQGDLRCLKLDDGEEIWSRSYVKDFKGLRPTYGFAGAPFLMDDKLIVVPGGKGTGVVAIDPNTGSHLWSAGKDGAGYSSPIAIAVNGLNAIAVFNSYGLCVINPSKGSHLARVQWKTDHGINAALPLYADGHIFIVSGYGKGGGLFEFVDNSLQLVYGTRKVVCQFQSPILVGDYMYAVSGDNNTKAKLSCMRLDSGELKWTKSLGGNRGNVITAAGNLIVVTERGEVLLCDASEKGHVDKGRFQAVGGRCWAPPAFADGQLYIRNNSGRLMCYDLR